jgi:glycosyltransferase involved in cell wall biosynthesis
VALAWTFPSEWRLVIHGSTSGDNTFLESLKLAAPSDRVVFSTHHIDEEGLSGFISGADLGVVFYRSSNPNELHTGYASEKAARYAEAGVPFVSFAVPTFAEVFARFGCGMSVTRIEELTEVAGEIFKEHERYAKGARQAFDEVYNFDAHKEKLAHWLRGIIEV